MSDSDEPDRLGHRHDRERERRIEAIKRWVDYLEAEPPEVWGPQQNAVVDDQLDAAQHGEISAAHRQRVRDVAAAITRETADDDTK